MKEKGSDIIPLEDLTRLPGSEQVTDDLEHALDVAEKYGRGYPDEYAGRLVLHGHLVVGFTRNVRRRVEALQGLLPGLSVLAFRADYSYKELSLLKDRIASEFEILRSKGLHVSGVGIAEDRNRVHVMLVDEVDEKGLKMLDDLYGLDTLFVSRTGHFELA